VRRVWLDVTSILQWNRPAVGVIRVELECAKYALDQLAGNVDFCRFDRQTGYLRVSCDEVREAIGRIHGTHVDGARPTSVSPSAPRANSFVVFVKRILSVLPSRIRTPIYDYLVARRMAALSIVNGLRELRRAWTLWHAPPPSGIAHANIQPKKELRGIFSQGDVYVSLGLDWDQKDLQFIAAEKATHQFKTIFCCYDIIPVKFPHLCVGDVASTFARYFADLAWCADEIVCISECSRRDLIALLDELGTPIPQATVIRLGSNLPERPGENVSISVKETVGDRFILFVSTLERRKNHETLYRAYTRLVDEGEKDLPKMIFVGMPGWGVADFLSDLRLDRRTKDLIEILNNVSDADLSWLYSHAMFTVFPSLYEGWGLAVAESLAAGKACLASSAASIPEIGGNLVEYLDPWNVPQWAERLKWYFNNPEALKALEQQIREKYRPPSWEDTARTIFNRAQALPLLPQ